MYRRNFCAARPGERADWRTTIDLVLERYGKLDVLVNNAAVSRSHAERDLLEDYRASG